MSSDDSRHVQTELDPDEYESFREFARERGLSIKEASREAMIEWVQRQRRPDPNDPAFTVLDELEEEPDGESVSNVANEDDLVEEWHGRDVEFDLADDPASKRQ